MKNKRFSETNNIKQNVLPAQKDRVQSKQVSTTYATVIPLVFSGPLVLISCAIKCRARYAKQNVWWTQMRRTHYVPENIEIDGTITLFARTYLVGLL